MVLVQRSELPLTRITPAAVGVKARPRLVVSMSCHAEPLLLMRWNWLVLDFATTEGSDVTRRKLMQVSLKRPPIGPAPA